MPDCRDNGCLAVPDCSCYDLFVKRPQILDGSAASSYDDDIHTSQCIQRFNSVHDRLRSLIALHDSRAEDDPDSGNPGYEAELFVDIDPGSELYREAFEAIEAAG